MSKIFEMNINQERIQDNAINIVTGYWLYEGGVAVQDLVGLRIFLSPHCLDKL
jgi:hypothetical protein